MEDSLETKISTWDDPSFAPDTLRRSEFAKRVAKGLSQWSSNESLVTAIYGPWGSGKTWLLRRLEENLTKDANITVCHFSPWQYENSAQITSEFFATISRALDLEIEQNPKGQTRAILWKKLGQAVVVGQITAITVAAALGAQMPDTSALVALKQLLNVGEDGAKTTPGIRGISEIRSDLYNLFIEPEAKRILVMIDDIDRLEDDHIRMIFRLVKTTANFPNLHYLLLGERRQMAGALDGISNNQGDRYLEKIVQIPLTLPQANGHEIRGRLWEGLEIVARECGYKLESHVERFESFWRGFLRKSLLTYRNVHRLLVAVSFHAKCLTRDGALEVDLLDLLGIDFMRGHAPKMYDLLSSDPPDSVWLVSNTEYGHDVKDRKDSKAVLKLVNECELDAVSSFRLLVYLFPGFYSLLPETTKQRRFSGNDHQKFKLSPAHRPVWDDRFQPLYFQITSDAGFFPANRYREFLSLKDPLAMIERFDSWAKLNWRDQLISALNDDPAFCESGKNAEAFLLALSSVSDELETDGSIIDRELDTAARLWLKKFGTIPEPQRMALLRRLVTESKGISILLLVIEQLRARSKSEFYKGTQAEAVIPSVSKNEVEELTDLFMPQIERRFMSRYFPVAPNQAWRLYRLAHAIGPFRFEKVLRRELAQIETDAGWSIAKAVIASLMPSIRLDLFTEDSVIPAASRNIIEGLFQFASADYWREFLNLENGKANLSEVDSVVLRHIQTGLEALNEVEGAANSDD